MAGSIGYQGSEKPELVLGVYRFKTKRFNILPIIPPEGNREECGDKNSGRYD